MHNAPEQRAGQKSEKREMIYEVVLSARGKIGLDEETFEVSEETYYRIKDIIREEMHHKG